MKRTLGWICSLGLIFLLLGVSAGAQTATGTENEASEDGVICYGYGAAFVFTVPPGWHNDRDTAARFGICAMAYPEGYTFDTAPVVMYPQLGPAQPGTGCVEAADRWAGKAAGELRNLPGGQNLTVRQGQTRANPLGLTFALRFFDNGPHPNVEEAGAYAVFNGAVLAIIISAREKGALPGYLPDLHAALDRIAALELVEGN